MRSTGSQAPWQAVLYQLEPAQTLDSQPLCSGRLVAMGKGALPPFGAILTGLMNTSHLFLELGRLFPFGRGF